MSQEFFLDHCAPQPHNTAHIHMHLALKFLKTSFKDNKTFHFF